jgi:hypothetical protein
MLLCNLNRVGIMRNLPYTSTPNSRVGNNLQEIFVKKIIKIPSFGILICKNFHPLRPPNFQCRSFSPQTYIMENSCEDEFIHTLTPATQQYTDDRREKWRQEKHFRCFQEENSSTMDCHIIKFMKCYSFCFVY